MTWQQDALEQTTGQARPAVAEIRGLIHQLENDVKVAVQRLSDDPDVHDTASARDRLYKAAEALSPIDRSPGIVQKLRAQHQLLSDALTRVEELGG